ncbi:DUF2283 domain-containing protein [Candidatus Woesearchaeota archaeon]|nr:DUF2283 domain-containing protein [Candidatus Woesearchaeota archaeon]
MEKFSFMYDREVDSLFVYNGGRKTYASIKMGEIIVSFDRNNNVSSVEILNPDLLYKIPKSKLSMISSARIQAQQRGEVLWIYVILAFQDKKTETLPVQLQLERPVSARG